MQDFPQTNNKTTEFSRVPPRSDILHRYYNVHISCHEQCTCHTTQL